MKTIPSTTTGEGYTKDPVVKVHMRFGPLGAEAGVTPVLKES
jgi:hypothetical protein